MRHLNILLFIFNILFFIYDLKLSKNLSRIKKNQIQGSKMLLSILVKLSESMNGQILVVEFQDVKIMEIIKYQQRNLWGIKILYELKDIKDKYEELEEWLLKKNILFEIKSYSNQIKGLIIDCKNNLNEAIDIIEFILYKIELIPSTNKPIYYFLRDTVEY